MNSVPASVPTRNSAPKPYRTLLLLPDLRYPSTFLRQSYAAELQTPGDLFLAEVIAMESPNHKTSRYSVRVTRASDGRTLTYDKLICKMRARKDGSVYHRITISGIGGCETLSEAVALVLTDASTRPSFGTALNQLHVPVDVQVQAVGA